MTNTSNSNTNKTAEDLTMTNSEAKATKVRGEMYHVTEQFKNI